MDLKHVVCCFGAVLLAGCGGQPNAATNTTGYSRPQMIAAAKQIIKCPGYATSAGGGGAGGMNDDGEPLYHEWSFLVSGDSFRDNGGTRIPDTSLLWEVFQDYSSFVRGCVDVDQIPDMIARGGSASLEPNATHYDYRFVSKDVTIGFGAEWFRGGPQQPDSDSEEVLVTIRIRVN